MPQKISSTPVRKTSPLKSAVPGKLEVGQVLLPLFQTALDAKNGLKPRFAPTADQLKGAVSFDVPMVMSGGTATLYATSKGELLVKTRAGGTPDQWAQVDPAIIKHSVDSLRKNTQLALTEKPAQADASPALDASPEHSPFVAQLRVINGKVYLSADAEPGTQHWFRLEPRKARPAWQPKPQPAVHSKSSTHCER